MHLLLCTVAVVVSLLLLTQHIHKNEYIYIYIYNKYNFYFGRNTSGLVAVKGRPIQYTFSCIIFSPKHACLLYATLQYTEPTLGIVY